MTNAELEAVIKYRYQADGKEYPTDRAERRRILRQVKKNYKRMKREGKL